MAVEERIQQSLERAAEPSGTPDVRLDQVTKRFDDVVAVDDLSLEIPRGSFRGGSSSASRSPARS